MKTAKAYAATSPSEPLSPLSIERRSPTPSDVEFEVLFCGVCHSDLHMVRNEWRDSVYPLVPGHEIVGRVTSVGSNVKTFKKNDLVAVGCLVDSCRGCSSCKAGLEQYCMTGGMVLTYNSPDKYMPGKMTYGGYSTALVVDEKFALHVPSNLDLAATAPLLCAGITTYSPLKHWGITKGKKVGIVGLGGLGHMGLKLSSAFGAETVLFTTSVNKTSDAKRFGASDVVISSDENQMKKHAGSFDFILDTVAAEHNLDSYLDLLKLDGTLCLVGLPEHSHPSPSTNKFILGRKSLAGSLIGGIKETQEMLNFCGEHNIVSDIEIIPMQKINEAYERMLKSDVKYRFVIDMASLK